MISTPCRWCPSTQECHAYGSLLQSCAIPVHTNDVSNTDYARYSCEAANFPHAAGDFSNADVDSLAQWVIHYLNDFKGEKHPFNDYEGGGSSQGEDLSGVYAMDDGRPLSKAAVSAGWPHGRPPPPPSSSPAAPSDVVRIAVASDWGSGTWESAAVSRLSASFAPHFTFHLGDVYYESLPEEIDANVLGVAPNAFQQGVAWHGGSRRSFFLNANHEMLSLGAGYFDHLLPKYEQAASFASLENEHWRVVAMDSGYEAYNTFEFIHAINELSETDAPQPLAVLKWLNETLGLGGACGHDKRGIVFLSHHQPFSDFNADESYLGTARQLAALLPKGCTVLWLTGHEHQLSIYDKVSSFDGVELAVYHRLVGNGGFPQRPQAPSKHTALKACTQSRPSTGGTTGGPWPSARCAD